MSVNQPEEMFAFEQELKQAMRAVDPPEGFADRLMARVEAPGASVRSKVLTMARRPQTWVGGAVAAAVLVGALVGDQAHVRRQREKTLQAQQQFEAAMRITGETLDEARQQLQRAGVPVGE
jgi:hypothetical protein